MNLRLATEGDLAFVSALSEAFKRFGPYEEIIPQWFRDRLVHTYIFEERDQPVGFFMLGLMLPAWLSRGLDLMAIAVVPERRGCGVGTYLVEAAKGLALARRYRFLRAHVGCDNEAALALFRKTGFRLKKRIENYYPSGLPAYELIADLKK